jgi:TRAP-type C4-dicarboxylate transport system permease small subunit
MKRDAPARPDLPAILETASGWLGGTALLLLTLLQVASVVARTIGWVVPASSELALVLVVTAVSAALVAATAHGSHPHVSALLRKASPRLLRVIGLAVKLIALGYWLALCIEALVLARAYALVGERTEILGISVIPLRAVWIAGLASVSLLLAWQILRKRAP